jgi:ABC-type uncharacterized transport system involved in gliding motility auxiliary subunit
MNHKPLIEKLAIAAGWSGALLSIGGLIVLGINPAWRWAVTFIESAALVLLVFFFTVQFETVKSFSTRRSTKLGLNSILMVILFLSILGILNFLSKRHSVQVDLSETDRFTLAPQTTKVLSELPREVKITAFTQSQSRGEGQIKDLLETYRHQTPRISYELIDPDRKPAVAKQYGITQYDTLVLESGKQETQVKQATEQELTNAIIRVSKDEKRKVLFLTGHGEHDLTDTEQSGYSRAKEALEKQGYEVESLSLLQTGSVPENTTVLIIAGPQRPVLPLEKEALAIYLGKGGKLLALLDPLVQTDLEDLLAQWGLRLGSGLVVDTLSRLFGGDFTVPVVTNYPPHEITGDFRLATFFPLARTVSFDSSKADLEFHPLAETTPNSWSKTDPSTRDLNFDPQADVKGPVTLAGIVTPKKPQPAPEEPLDEGAALEDTTGSSTAEPILVVFGDSDFASNNTFNFSGNGDLFLNTINYLTQEKGLIAITPKEHHFSPLFLTRIQGSILMYVSLIIMPAVVFITGLGIWRRRRRL